MADCFDAYDSIWCVDFEFGTPIGDPPDVRCCVATEYRTGRTHQVWLDGVHVPDPPFTCGPKDLFVAYLLTAEINCYRQLGWPLPHDCLDLYVEFVRHLNGKITPHLGRKLVDAMSYFGVPFIDLYEKKTMQQLAVRGGPYSEQEKHDLLEYCAGDVVALCQLLPHFFPIIGDYKSACRAVYAGRYMKALSALEMRGVPIDGEALSELRESWDKIKTRVTWRVNLEYNVYVPTKLGRTSSSTKQGQAILERAEALGVSASHLGQATYEILDRYTEHIRSHSQAIEAARRKTGLTVAKISEWENAGKDHSTWPQLDVAARELASEHPELGLGPAFGDVQQTLVDHAENLWEILRAPTPRLSGDFQSALDEASTLVDTSPDADLDVPLSFSQSRFADWCIRNDVPWPRLESGDLDLKSESFDEQAKAHPSVAKLHELRETLASLNLFRDLAVGSDSRNRCMLSPYRARSGRNQPSNSRFIFGPHVWVRHLIKPTAGMAVAYIDFAQQEAAIGAALSGDKNMMECYQSGDFYLNFCKACGELPQDAKREDHEHTRDLYKRACLGIMYRMGETSLAQYLGGVPVATARRILRQHKDTFWKFWQWSELAVDRCHLTGSVSTVFGWPVHLNENPNPRSIANHPCQGNGSEMLRLSICLMVERGIRACAPVHDAILIEAPTSEIERETAGAQQCMREASLAILDGFEVKTDAKIVRWPDRYSDPRGVAMWLDVRSVLEEFRRTSPDQSGDSGLPDF